MDTSVYVNNSHFLCNEKFHEICIRHDGPSLLIPDEYLDLYTQTDEYSFIAKNNEERRKKVTYK